MGYCKLQRDPTCPRASGAARPYRYRHLRNRCRRLGGFDRRLDGRAAGPVAARERHGQLCQGRGTYSREVTYSGFQIERKIAPGNERGGNHLHAMNTEQQTWPKNEARGVMIAITLLTGSELFLSAAIPVMLPDLAGPLGVSADEMSWAQTLYSAAFLVAIPTAMWLAKRIGHGRCLTRAAGVFTVATLGLALSPNFETFLVLRLIQGLAGGMFLVRSQITMYNIVPRQFLAYVLLWFCIGSYTLRALGAWLSGWMDDTLSWRWAFAGPAALSYLAWQFGVRYLQHLRTNDESERDSIGGRTLVILAMGLVCLQCVLSRGEI